MPRGEYVGIVDATYLVKASFTAGTVSGRQQKQLSLVRGLFFRQRENANRY
jgi:hypothetical protein